jgi:hypothetical protein
MIESELVAVALFCSGIGYCVGLFAGIIHERGRVAAEREALRRGVAVEPTGTAAAWKIRKESGK